MLINLKYLNREETSIQALNEENNHILIEQDVNLELFNDCVSGVYGPIENFDDSGPEIETDPLIIYRTTLECSRLQAKAVLYQNGILDQVDALVANSDFLVQLAWKEAQVIKRASPLIEMLKSQLTWVDDTPITDEDLDTLFEEAKKIEF
jgi:hypothetical protein